MGVFKYPLAVTPCRYITEVGGRSRALAEGNIGLHIEALQQNTNLSSGDRVLLDTTKGKDREGPAPEPLYRQSPYRIEALREDHNPHLLSIASDGRAILSQHALRELDIGDEIILNSAVDRIPKGWVVKQIHRWMED